MNTGWKLPGTVETSGEGVGFNSISNLLIAGEYAYTGSAEEVSFYHHAQYLYNSGVIGNNNGNTGAITSVTPVTYTFGSANNKWGNTLTREQVAAAVFGVALKIRLHAAEDTYTTYLIGHNFGFSIPSSARITGYEVKIDARYSSTSGYWSYIRNLYMRVHYDIAAMWLGIVF
jgi:hypothetical protein